jgi:hypothetical protein
MPDLVGALIFAAIDESALGATAVAGTVTWNGIVGGSALLAEMTSATTLDLEEMPDRPRARFKREE